MNESSLITIAVAHILQHIPHECGLQIPHFIRKGGEDLSLAINLQSAQWIDDYLAAAGHGNDAEGPLFRPLRKNQPELDLWRPLHPVSIDLILRKYAVAAR